MERVDNYGLGVIHGITAVAELKDDLKRNSFSCILVIHGITAVAELKAGPMSAPRPAPLTSSTASPPWPN